MLGTHVDSFLPLFVGKRAFQFLRENAFAALFLSVLILIPCFWHAHIQAGDLGSHIYNAWLAQLAERQEIPGVVVVDQWSNVLFDLMVLHIANWFGFPPAEKIAVSLVVLVFFWGAFSFIASVSGRPPWLLTPFLAVLAYGYAFHMGFMNYCLSMGLAFLGLAAVWQGGAVNWLVSAIFAALAFFAHPIGLVVFIAVASYVLVWRVLPGRARAGVPLLAMASFILLHRYFLAHPEHEPSWRGEGIGQLLGQDQMNVYGHSYLVLSWVAVAWGAVSVVAALYDWVFRAGKPSRALRLALELYVVAIAATVYLPENFRTGLYAGWVGLLVSRLTLVTAVFGLLLLGSLRLPGWTWRGAAVTAAIFFALLYRDTGRLGQMESNARSLAESLAPGTRIVGVASPPGDWRVAFIYHSIDRACIGRCFSFANYEASSLQFRVRALPGNRVVTTSVDQSDDMSSGDYRVQSKDLPLVSIYPCDEADFTKLCALPLREGQKTEDPESEPAPATDEE
jgi:GNAT superfamily N-acetyltransferase